MQKRRDWFVLLFLLVGIFLLFYLGFGLFTPRASLDGLALSGGDKVGLIKILGPIYNSKPILDQLSTIEKNPSIKAILVRLETPGGGVAASQEIYQRLVYLRDEKKLPIVASMGAAAASGGYYVALGADTIVANPGSLTGSIGVILEWPTYGTLMRKIGVELEVIKSGKFKDTGSIHRSLTPEEKDYLQAVVDDTYEEFLATVVRERALPIERARQLADGRIFTGRQAQQEGLVDLLGGYDEALKLAGEMAGISGSPEVVEIPKKKITLWDLLFYDLEEFFYLHLGLAAPLKYQLSRNIL